MLAIAIAERVDEIGQIVGRLALLVVVIELNGLEALQRRGRIICKGKLSFASLAAVELLEALLISTPLPPWRLTM